MFQTTKQFYMAFIPWVHWVHPTCLGIRTDMTLGSAPFTNWITPTYPIAGMYIMNNIKKNWLRTVIIFSTHWAHSVMKCRSRSSPSWRVATETTTWCRMMSRFFGGCPNTLDLTGRNLMECFYLLWACFVLYARNIQITRLDWSTSSWNFSNRWNGGS